MAENKEKNVVGNRIHATIRKMHMEQHKKLLIEGRIYAIRDFLVTNQTDKYKACETKYKIIFHGKTHMFEMFDKSYPRFMYEFKDFRELYDFQKIDDTMLFDIIGRVVSMQSAQTTQVGGKSTRFLDITLEDLDKNRMTCTLWEEYIDIILPYLEEHSREPIVIILQMCRAKMFKDEVKVSNSFHITKLIVNGEDEIMEFKKRFSFVHGNNPICSISHVAAPSNVTISDNLASSESSIRTIEQLYTNRQIGSFWVCGTIISFIGDWWYLSCPICPKKLSEAGDKLYCFGCDKFPETGQLRYKLEIQVVDETGNVPLLLWDRDCEKLIGKPCAVLRSEYLDMADGRDIPDEIASLIDVQAFFKVQVKGDQYNHYDRSLTVLKLTTNPALIKEFSRTAFESQESDFLSKLHHEGEFSIKDDSSEDEVNTPNKSAKQKEVVRGSPAFKRALLDDFASSTSAKKLKEFVKKEEDDEKK